MPRPSDQSYRDFVRSAYGYFMGLIDPSQPNAGAAARALYDIYKRYHPDPLIGPKIPLAGNGLYTALVNLIGNVGGRVVRVQSDGWRVMDNDSVRQEYQARLDGGNDPLGSSAAAARTSYLHVYPTGTVATGPAKVSLPDGRPGVGDVPRNNWRIGINIEPDSMAAAVGALMGIMDANVDINHIKFSAPGTAGKPDSVIVYLRKRPQTYAALRLAVQQAVAGLNIQPKFSPMWNEFAAGLAEAGEPPVGGGSFGQYRCNLATQAYGFMRAIDDSLTLNDYLAWTDAVFEIFGIPQFAPHEQGPLDDPLYDNEMRLAFMQVLALRNRNAPDHYGNRQLVDR